MGLMLVNVYKLLPVDSIINDVCMILVSFAAPDDDKQLSQEAAHGTAVNPMAIGQKSGVDELPDSQI